MELLPPPHVPPPRWNTKKANWKLNQMNSKNGFRTMNQQKILTKQTRTFTVAIQHAARESNTKTNPTNRHHKDYWFYKDEVRSRITESTHSEDISSNTLP
ncbi:hypothetical protein Hamer_G025569 [Homarus americanus]|uniref:Uncharacterized protein n=1 Tax=Homarus americanus TaxID=6706 RepID=A0A8J5K8Y5_HOMAM|nr:hypothetical protein Hamer_G025569 [Homarus americanus]